MADTTIRLDEETYERLARLAALEGAPVEDLVRKLTDEALYVKQVLREFEVLETPERRAARRAAAKASELAARARVQGFSARDNLPRDQIYRG